MKFTGILFLLLTLAVRSNLYAQAKSTPAPSVSSTPDLEKADYENAIGIEPKNAIAHNNRGIYFLKNGDKTSALTDFNKAIELNPKLVIAYRNRAYFYNQTGEKEKAGLDEKMAETIENSPVKQ